MLQQGAFGSGRERLGLACIGGVYKLRCCKPTQTALLQACYNTQTVASLLHPNCAVATHKLRCCKPVATPCAGASLLQHPNCASLLRHPKRCCKPVGHPNCGCKPATQTALLQTPKLRWCKPVATLKLRCCKPVATPKLRCCKPVATAKLRCCKPVATPKLRCCKPVATRKLRCCKRCNTRLHAYETL